MVRTPQRRLVKLGYHSLFCVVSCKTFFPLTEQSFNSSTKKITQGTLIPKPSLNRQIQVRFISIIIIKSRLFRYFFIPPYLNKVLKTYSEPIGKTKLKGLECICETVMKNRFISSSEARLSRFEVANSKKNMAQSEINNAIRSRAIILSNVRMKQVAYE
jgi:hypothetical protein